MSAAPCCDLHGRNCEPPSELCCWECTEARHSGWTDERGRQRHGHPAGEECSAPDLSLPMWPDSAGAFLHNMLGGTEPEPGPPYTHTLVPPEPIGEDEDGNLLYPEPGPAFTLTEG